MAFFILYFVIYGVMILGYERHIWCAGRFAEMKKFFVSLLLLLSMAVTYALPPLEGLWEQDALFSKDYEIRISEHYIVLFDKTIENSKAQIFEYKGTSEGTIFINNFYVSLASKYEEFNNRYFSYEREGNKLVLKGNSGGEIKLKRCPDTPYMADFWCEDKIGSSRFFLDVSYDKFIYVAKDGSFTNVWEIEDLNATEKWIKLKHKDYISSEVNDVIRNHLMQSDYISYDRKGEKMTLDLSTGKLKLVTDARKTFVKNVAIGAGVTAAVVTAAVVGYNVYNSQQLADNSQKQSYNNGKTSSGKNSATVNKVVNSANKVVSSTNRYVGENRQTKVYRVLRPDENPKQGLFAKNPSRNMTIEGHISSGSRNNGSQYISTTTDINVARKWAEQDGCRIVEIDLNKVDSPIYDLSTDEGRNLYLKGVSAKNFAKASSEVLVEGSIPSAALKIVE